MEKMIIGEIKLPEMQSKDPIQEVELIVFGDIQGVGYRQYVAGIGRKLNLVGYVKNIKDGTVHIRCKGKESVVKEFKMKINVNNPNAAPLIDVKDVKEKTLKPGTLKQKFFEEKYGELKAEMSQGNTTGMNYLNLFNKDTQANLNLFRTDTIKSFEHMDDKYNAISMGMFSLVKEIKETNKTFESKIEKTEKSIESLEKDIKSLLNFLIDKKS